MLFSALFVAYAILLPIGVKALLLERPCFVPGNAWKRLYDVHHQARPVAMMGENVGHNPFNTFPGMEKYGNCMEVHFNLFQDTINITIVCGDMHGLRPRTVDSDAPHTYQCPKYVPGVAWPVKNLIYLEYDVRRFELSSCVTLNETHSYHGFLMLTDDIEPKIRRNLWPMWRRKLQHPNTVLFQFEGNCSECNFRNEYIAYVQHLDNNMDLAPPEAQPYCRDGQPAVSKPATKYRPIELNAATSDLMMKLLIPGAMLFGGVILIRFCICKKKPATEIVVVPTVAVSKEKH